MADTPSLGNILVVDDNIYICELLQVNLGSEGYSVAVEPDASKVAEMPLDTVQLIIVDAMKQEYSGMDLIYDLKDNPDTEGIALILYSPVKSERMAIDALEAGADDYISKPFSLRELMARIRAILRRHSRGSKASSLTFLSLTMDQVGKNVKIDGLPVPLTSKEYAILQMLLKNPDTLISRIEIFRKVWPESTAGSNERIVDTNVSRLRKKLGNLSQHLISRTGHGYMLSTNV